MFDSAPKTPRGATALAAAVALMAVALTVATAAGAETPAPAPAGGQVSAQATDTVPPVTRVFAPPVISNVSANGVYTLRWQATDEAPSSGIASYALEYKDGYNGLWRTLSAATGTTSRKLRAQPGRTYFFRARATDGDGNVGPWSPTTYATMPFHHGSASYRGRWRTVRGRWYFMGSTRYATARGARASFTFYNARSVGLVVTKRPTGGIAEVWIGRKRVRVISLYSRRNHARVYVPIQSYSIPMKGRLSVVVTGRKVRASRGTGVELDGIAIRTVTRPIFGIDSRIDSIEPTSARLRALRKARDAGSRWVRATMFWPWMDRNVGSAPETATARDWRVSDRWIRESREHQQEPVAVLLGWAAWANGQPSHPYFVPSDTGPWLDFVRDTVTRYKDDVHYWEVWNEPNGPFWEVPEQVDGRWVWRHKPDPEDYARLLIPTYRIIKQIDPTSEVLFGGVDRNHYSYLRRAYVVLRAQPDASANNNFFDILSVHPYCDNRPPESTDRRYDWSGMNRNFTGLPGMKRIMNDNGDRHKHVMITEMAWPLKDFSYSRRVTRAQQAAYLGRAYQMLQRWPWVDMMMWYGFKNWRNGSDWEEDPFSIVDMDLSPRPSYYSYRREASR